MTDDGRRPDGEGRPGGPGTPLATVVTAADHVATTPSRTAKIAALAELVGSLRQEEVAVVVAWLVGEPRQRRTGVGWAGVGDLTGRAGEASLAVMELDAAIDRLAAATGPGSVARRRDELDALMARATTQEGAFIRRLLLGELRHGALTGIVADAVGRAAGVPATLVRRAAMLAGDLPRVAAVALAYGQPGLEEIGLTVGTPVLPMLASTADDVASAMVGCGLVSVEWKLDGARVQAHRSPAGVRLFTRNLNEITDRLGGVVEAVAGLDVTSLVLDGEVLGTAEDASPEPFQDTMSRFSRQGASEARLVVRFFDCLHVDGRDLIDEPLTVRRAALEAAVPAPLRIPSLLTDDPDAAVAFAEGALAAGHEGVMVKVASSTYEAGRRGKAWRKVKPVRTLDLVVLGVEWGSGRRRGWLSNLHLGARSDDGFVMVGKTFKGMTDEMLRWQTARFLGLESGREGHVVWVRPEQVVEIAVDGVQRSARYPGGVALRFARVRRYRDDKTPGEADTIDDVRSLRRG